ncbi:hypothetical protein PLEOSDRAFT_1110584, partial [Pleurotus ostreatus PC15]
MPESHYNPVGYMECSMLGFNEKHRIVSVVWPSFRDTQVAMTPPSYPNEIPALTSVPSWAYLNIE